MTVTWGLPSGLMVLTWTNGPSRSVCEAPGEYPSSRTFLRSDSRSRIVEGKARPDYGTSSDTSAAVLPSRCGRDHSSLLVGRPVRPLS